MKGNESFFQGNLAWLPKGSYAGVRGNTGPYKISAVNVKRSASVSCYDTSNFKSECGESDMLSCFRPCPFSHFQLLPPAAGDLQPPPVGSRHVGLGQWKITMRGVGCGEPSAGRVQR